MIVGDALAPLGAGQLIIYEDADVYRRTLLRLRGLLNGLVSRVLSGHRRGMDVLQALEWIGQIETMVDAIERLDHRGALAPGGADCGDRGLPVRSSTCPPEP